MDQINRFLDQHLTPACKQILLLNVIVFLAVAVTRAMHLNIESLLLLRPLRGGFLLAPWGVLTYMFLHVSFLHLLFNMLMLWFIGPELENRWGTRRFWRFYLLTGAGAGLLNVLINALVPLESGFVLGASGAIYGLALAFAAYHPTATFLLFGIVPMQAQIMVLGMAVIAIFGVLSPGGSGVSHLTHLLGFGIGYVLLAQQHRDWDFKTWRWR